MEKKVIIDCFPNAAQRYRDNYAVIAIDVIRATTTGATAVRYGRRVYPVQSTDEAFMLASGMDNPLLVGEIGGNVPYGFHFTNSPVIISALTEVHLGTLSDINRQIIFLSSSGTQLIKNAAESEAVYISCFRNFRAVAEYVMKKHSRIAIIGAGTRGQFRREDQIGCAWVAEILVESGFQACNKETQDLIERWHGIHPEIIRDGRSAEYLRKSGQTHDLEFIISHIDDLDVVPVMRDGELVNAPH